jgi:serine/threonine protein kinase
MEGSGRSVRPSSPGSRVALPGYTPLRGLAVDRAGALVEVTEDASGRLFVVRVLSPALTSDAGFMRRLRLDVAILRPLRHPNLVAVWAYDDRAKALLYGDVGGVTLGELLGTGTPLDAAAAFLVFDDCLAGLAELHRVHVLHRDVHPDAIVIDSTAVARLRDAGVPVPPLHAGWRAGTPSYMAPELWAGQPHTPSSDIYAAACVFVEALTGHRAFPSAELTSLQTQHEHGMASIADLPAAAHRLAAAGLAVNARERPSDASAYRADLAVVAAATMDQSWRDQGRVWLTHAVKRSMDAPPPLAAAVPPMISDEDFAEMSPKRAGRGGWRRRRLWASIAAAVVALGVVSVVAVAALTGSGRTTGTDSGPVAGASESPSSSDTPLASPSDSATPSDAATPTTASTPAGSLSTAAQITPSTEQPSLGPATSATPTPTPKTTPTPKPTPTPTCLPLPPFCP